MDFRKRLEELENYLNNYEKYLNDYNIKPPKITTEYIDFDKFKNDFVLYMEFDSSSFPLADKNNDDCSQTELLKINIYLVFRNDTPKNLNNKTMDATSAFYSMAKELNISGLVFSSISKIDFFKYIEGTANIYASKITLDLSLET